MHAAIRYPASVVTLLATTAAIACRPRGVDSAAGRTSSQSTAAAALRAPRPVAFEHVTVVPMDRERTIEDQTVVTDSGRIVAIGGAGSVRVPVDAERIDARGKFLLPGLADVHAHLYDTNGFLSYLAWGVTTIANLNGFPEVLAWRDDISSGRRLGPTIYTAGPSINGNPPGNSTFVAVETPEQARAAVREQATAGYDFIKVYSTLTPDTYHALLSEARSLHLAALGHIATTGGFEDLVASKYQSNVAHGEEYLSSVAGSPDDTSRIAWAAGETRRAGITVTPNLFAYVDYLHAIADLPGVLGDSEMRFASPALLSEKLPAHNRSVRDNPSSFADYLTRGHAWIAHMTRALSDSGVPLLLGTDTEIFGFPGASALAELHELQQAGLTPYQALAAATKAPGEYVRRFMHEGEHFGVVEVGARADLLLLSANPLRQPDVSQSMLGVLVRGRWLPRAVLAAMRDSVARVTLPQRVEAQAIDSLIRGKHIDEAVRRFRSFRSRWPGTPPLAEVVLEQDAEHLFPTDPRAAIAVLGLDIESYPRSFSLLSTRARAELSVGDSAAARRDVAAALALEPASALTQALDEELRIAGHRVVADPVGRYALARNDPYPTHDSVSAKWRGTLEITKQGSDYRGELRVGERTVPLSYVVATGDRLFAWAGHYPDDVPEMRLTIAGDSIYGRLLGGFGSNHVVAGRRIRPVGSPGP